MPFWMQARHHRTLIALQHSMSLPVQVLLVLDNPDHLTDDQLPAMEGLQLRSISASGETDNVATDLVVSVNMR